MLRIAPFLAPELPWPGTAGCLASAALSNLVRAQPPGKAGFAADEWVLSKSQKCKWPKTETVFQYSSHFPHFYLWVIIVLPYNRGDTSKYIIVIFFQKYCIGSVQDLFANTTAPVTLKQTQPLRNNGKMPSPGNVINSPVEWKYLVVSITPCKGPAVPAGSSTQAALTLWRSQLGDVLSGFIIRIFGCYHLVPVAVLFVQHMWDLQRSLSLCSQIQILLSKVGPQLPDFKLEEKTTSHTDVIQAWPEVCIL